MALRVATIIQRALRGNDAIFLCGVLLLRFGQGDVEHIKAPLRFFLACGQFVLAGINLGQIGINLTRTRTRLLGQLHQTHGFDLQFVDFAHGCLRASAQTA